MSSTANVIYQKAGRPVVGQARLPNLVRLSAAPPDPRIVWVIKVRSTGLEVFRGHTWRALRQAYERINTRRYREIVGFWVLDLGSNEVTRYSGTESSIASFLEEWRKHYLDDTWIVPA
jgi:hypothetical protein